MECLSYCKSEKEEKSKKNVISQVLLYNEALAVAALGTPNSFNSPQDGAGPIALVTSATSKASPPTKNGHNSHFSRIPVSFKC